MKSHQQKIKRIASLLKNRTSTKPVSLKKKAPPHQVPKPGDKRLDDEKIEISDLNQILYIDPKNKTCTAEPGTTFVDIVRETLKYNLIPIIVPEHKTITIGGAVSGCSIESMSFKYGGFHDTCLEYEIITAKGEILTATPTNKNKLLFQMVHGAFGTLGIISKLKFKLIPTQPFVKLTHEKYKNLNDYKKAIWDHYQKQDVDYMDGIIFSPKLFVLSVGKFVDQAPYTNNYNWLKIYYQSMIDRQEDYLKTFDYIYRYDKGITNVSPQSFLGRLLFGKLINSHTTLTLVKLFHRWLPDKIIPITIDLMIPFSKINEYLSWHKKIIKHFPLWVVPYKIVRDYEWIADDFIKKTKDKLFLDIAIYNMRTKNKKKYYKLMESKLVQINGLKTLISNNYYTEQEFWQIWNKPNYDQVKRLTDPDNIFRNLYTKTCRTVMGL